MRMGTWALICFSLTVASPAAAQAPAVVVVPWTVGEADAEQVRASADATSLAIPTSAGAVVSMAETRTRFLAAGSADAPTVTSAEIDQWTQYSREAVRALANEDYTAARAALGRAQEISDRAAAEMSREETRARQVLDTCLFGVRAYIEQSDPHAEEQMLGCRRLVPRIAQSPNIHTPEVVELLTRVDRRLAAAHRGPLTVQSQPAGCTVRLNGVTLGQTPFTSEQLAPGEYRVQVECGEGGHGRVHRVTVDDTTGPVALRVDARFDAAVRTDSALRLVYADADDAAAHRAADARAIGAVLGADEVWLVGASADGALVGERVRVEGSDAVAIATASAPNATALVTALSSAPAESASRSGSGEIDGSRWALMIGGGVVAVAGAVMLGLGAGDFDAIASPSATDTYASAAARQSTGETLVEVGSVALGVGLVVAGIGVGLTVGDTSRGPGEHASLRVGPTDARFTLRF